MRLLIGVSPSASEGKGSLTDLGLPLEAGRLGGPIDDEDAAGAAADDDDEDDATAVSRRGSTLNTKPEASASSLNASKV